VLRRSVGTVPKETDAAKPRCWSAANSGSIQSATPAPGRLKRRLSHGNWCVGSAFFLCDLCFIEQQAGAGEWLVIKQNIPFESVSCGDMIDAGTFDAFLADIQTATTEQCAALKYRR
jgi:hypothetical protein